MQYNKQDLVYLYNLYTQFLNSTGKYTFSNLQLYFSGSLPINHVQVLTKI